MIEQLFVFVDADDLEAILTCKMKTEDPETKEAVYVVQPLICATPKQLDSWKPVAEMILKKRYKILLFKPVGEPIEGDD